MATATTTHRLSATALLGKGLTPGKLRGLQRISNPNGTLTMLALDQNSSMIEMAQQGPQGARGRTASRPTRRSSRPSST